ncbi:hypothetical protein CVCC1112_1877 [Paenarthrobacter nicotinovorans]|nr:hypothetical protein ANMWB30_44420 [Arthrobacter sp. MWB30]GAT87218.1 hypothetical protein CVCC1112_1877 [Paenarthrobacter nicotinovorans]
MRHSSLSLADFCAALGHCSMRNQACVRRASPAVHLVAMSRSSLRGKSR